MPRCLMMTRLPTVTVALFDKVHCRICKQNQHLRMRSLWILSDPAKHTAIGVLHPCTNSARSSTLRHGLHRLNKSIHFMIDAYNVTMCNCSNAAFEKLVRQIPNTQGRRQGGGGGHAPHLQLGPPFGFHGKIQNSD